MFTTNLTIDELYNIPFCQEWFNNTNIALNNTLTLSKHIKTLPFIINCQYHNQHWIITFKSEAHYTWFLLGLTNNQNHL